MIGYLTGQVKFLFADCCILDVGGVGYRVHIPAGTRNNLQKGDRAELFIHTAVREDAILLYGFSAKEEYDIFTLLISVSGVGAKVALGILSAVSVGRLCRAISGRETATLTKLPGIGKKTAERIILELKDKISMDISDSNDDFINVRPAAADADDEAAEALAALGYQRAEITAALQKADKGNSIQDTIKNALKYLTKNKF